MLFPILALGGALLVGRATMRTGRAVKYDVLHRLQVPSLLRSSRAKERCIENMANALALVNAEYLRENPRTPRVYTAGIRYCDDPKARYDEWCDIPTVLQRGCGDCDDLVPWRLAELLNDGVNAEAHAIEQRLNNGDTVFHLLIRYPGSNQTEDPSAILGMQ